MKKMPWIASLSLLSAASAWSAPVSYVFDTVTSFTSHRTSPVVVGVLRNEGNPTTLGWVEGINNADYNFYVDRCQLLILTMMEKPGRYYLTIAVDAALANTQLHLCRLELR